MFEFPLDLFKAVALARGKNDARPYLNGVYFEVMASDQSTLFIVATDGHRLHYARVALSASVQPFNTVVPEAVVRELIKVRQDKAVMIPNQISAGAVSLKFEPVEGTFPQWRRVVPCDTGIKQAEPLSNLVNVNPQFLADLWSAAKYLRPARDRFVSIRIEDPGYVEGKYSAVVAHRPEFGAIIMGARLKQGTLNKLPALE